MQRIAEASECEGRFQLQQMTEASVGTHHGKRTHCESADDESRSATKRKGKFSINFVTVVLHQSNFCEIDLMDFT